MLSSLRLTLRSLLKSPGFFATSVLILALGLAASTTAFTLVHTLFFKPRDGISDPAALFNLHPIAKATGDHESWSYPGFLELQSQTKSLAGLAAFTGFEAGLAHGSRSDSVKTQLVSGSFFAVLGVKPVLGRTFLPEEEKTFGSHPVALISHRYWRDSFGSDPAAIGSSVRINGLSFTIVGVLPPGFHGTFIGFDMDLWVPLAMARVISAEGDLERPDADWLELIGRLAPGVTPATAQSELAALARPQLAQRLAGADGYQVALLPNRPIDDDIRGSALGFLGALSVTAGLVLLIGCLNVSGLLLARAESRRREHAVRLALGSSRGQLVCQRLLEGLVVFSAGGLGGLLLAQWTADLALFRTPSQFIPLSFDFSLDWRAFAACFGLTLVTGMLTSLAPALRATQVDLAQDLKTGGAHGSTSSTRLRSTLVVAQLAFCVVPLVTAGLFYRAIDQARRISPGYTTRGLLTEQLNISLLSDDFAGQGQLTARRLLERARHLPGVTSATLANRIPVGLGSLSTGLTVDNPPSPLPKEGLGVGLNVIEPAYFETLGIPLLSGQTFTADDDRAGAPPVAILNQAAAQRLFGTADAVGREVWRGKGALRVVAVVPDVKYSRLWEQPRPQLYLPLASTPRPRLQLLVRHEGSPDTVAPNLRSALQEAEPGLPLAPPRTAQESIDVTLLPQKLGAEIAAVLGALSLLLAAIGLYGLLTLDALRQTREFGVRVALGAQRLDLVQLVARRVLRLVGLGLLLGSGCAAALAGVLRGFLPTVGLLDPVSYGAVAFALATVAFLAAWLPARRAAKADPIVALRAE